MTTEETHPNANRLDLYSAPPEFIDAAVRDLMVENAGFLPAGGA
jgi:hypothetical protein